MILHELAEAILVNKDINKLLYILILMHVTDGLLLHNKELATIVAASSLDPKRAGQASLATRKAIFSKLNFISNIYLLWERFLGKCTMILQQI